MSHCAQCSRTDRSSRLCTIHKRLPTHPDALFTTPPQSSPKNPQTPHRNVSRSCASPRSSPPTIPSGCTRLSLARRMLSVAACPAARWAAWNRPRTRLFERRDGGSGQKARAGRQPDSRPANPGNGETPKASREGFLTAKVTGGGDVKAFPRCTGGKPGGAEAHEGRGSVEAQPVSTDTALATGSKALKASAGFEARGQPWAADDAQRHEGSGGRRARTATHLGKPLKSEPWTWLRGETNPQSRVEEETVEDVRNVEGGTARAWELVSSGLRSMTPR